MKLGVIYLLDSMLNINWKIIRMGMFKKYRKVRKIIEI